MKIKGVSDSVSFQFPLAWSRRARRKGQPERMDKVATGPHGKDHGKGPPWTAGSGNGKTRDQAQWHPTEHIQWFCSPDLGKMHQSRTNPLVEKSKPRGRQAPSTVYRYVLHCASQSETCRICYLFPKLFRAKACASPQLAGPLMFVPSQTMLPTFPFSPIPQPLPLRYSPSTIFTRLLRVPHRGLIWTLRSGFIPSTRRLSRLFPTGPDFTAFIPTANFGSNTFPL